MTLNRYTIVIIDDSPEDRATYRRYLLGDRRCDYTILEEEYGEQGLQLCERVKPDAVLLDFLLPDIDGLEFLLELQAANLKNCPPVIMLTGQGNEEIAVRALKSGAQDYLVKGRVTSESLGFTVRNVIENVRLRRQLEQSEARFRRLVESNIIGVAIGDLNGQISYANGAFLALVGYKQEELEEGKLNWREITPSEYWPRDEKAIQELNQLGICTPYEKECIGRDGSCLPILVGGASLEEGQETAIAFVMDLSDRKQAELEMRRALEQEKELSELKSRFVAMVSHEFRNPISAILGMVQLLEGYGDRFSESKKQTMLGHIKNAANKMNEIVDDVLAIGQAGMGKLKFEPALLDVEIFCKNLIDKLQLGKNGKHPIHFYYEGTKAAVMDEKLLHHILTNLLINAIKYSDEGSPVDVTASCQPPKINFQIRDRGIGIPQQDWQRLFEPFHRASNVGTRQGTGLGLAIVKQCVDLHGGGIDFDTKVGEGTLFRVTLPCGWEAMN
ncbi:response regulator [Candidatus Gracilibacteria bacterium]|nr:response regulator [Candidatus Gracilibacteria bacterium]NJM90195.1 response regulator [Hydrococcus sp. RU_2_2]NJP21450.1 response regulator [Hydrococcus sp. CRU_1_1]